MTGCTRETQRRAFISCSTSVLVPLTNRRAYLSLSLAALEYTQHLVAVQGDSYWRVMDFLFLARHPKENSSQRCITAVVDLHQLEAMPSAWTASGFFLESLRSPGRVWESALHAAWKRNTSQGWMKSTAKQAITSTSAHLPQPTAFRKRADQRRSVLGEASRKLREERCALSQLHFPTISSGTLSSTSLPSLGRCLDNNSSSVRYRNKLTLKRH